VPECVWNAFSHSQVQSADQFKKMLKTVKTY